MNGTLTIGPPGVSTPASVAIRRARSPPSRPKWRETTCSGMSTCMRPASISAGTRRGKMNLSIEKPFFAPRSGSPGSFTYATPASASASTTRTIVERSTSGRIAAPSRVRPPLIMAHGRYILAKMGPRPRKSRVDEFSLSVIEGVEDALLVTDARLGVIAWNGAMERLTGVARADALGRNAEAVLPFFRETALTTHLRRALAGHVVSTDEFSYALPSLGRK